MCRALNIILALLSRLLFALHGFAAVWCVVRVTGCYNYWVLLMGVLLLSGEMVITIKYTHNGEWKWFSPSVFLYLTTLVPSIWLLELTQLSENLNAICKNKNFVTGLEQTMFIVLVIGRWLMPKGDLSRDQLSQLLMVYVSLGADIMDILDIFDTVKEGIRKDVCCTESSRHNLIIMGLSLFSWALIQFTLFLSQTNDPKSQITAHVKPTSPYRSCCSNEIRSLLLTVGFQDGPFLFYRLYLMIGCKILNQDILFFTCKNILTVMLELYRIVVVYFELHRSRGRSRERAPDESQRETERGEVVESSPQE